MNISPLVVILYFQFAATSRALCRVLTEDGVEHEEMHEHVEDDWADILRSVQWASGLRK